MTARERPPAGPALSPEDAPQEAPPEEAALTAALRLLALRGRSRQELALALGRRGFSARVQEAVLARLVELGYLDDARLAAERARSLLARGRLGAPGVLQRLVAQGLPEAAARQAVEAAGAELGVDPLEAGRRLLEKKGLAGRPLTPRERAKAGRLLDARGFAEEDIQRLLPTSGLDPSQDEG